jgi:hypothetical protein
MASIIVAQISEVKFEEINIIMFYINLLLIPNVTIAVLILHW